MRIETERLLLRPWKDSDLAPFTRMNRDPEVMRFFPATLEPAQTEALYRDLAQELSAYGYGPFAAEEKAGGNFIGFIGFHQARLAVSFCPCVEIGWRLDKAYWGKGYAAEGARACLAHGFSVFALNEVYSFTSLLNHPSQRVMQKLGMQKALHFDHPEIPAGHPLRPHICYRIQKTNISG